jgi:hypothetical protein
MGFVGGNLRLASFGPLNLKTCEEAEKFAGQGGTSALSACCVCKWWAASVSKNLTAAKANNPERLALSLSLLRVRISFCSAKQGGGGVAVLSAGPRALASLTISETAIVHCYAQKAGGVLALSMSKGIIQSVNVTHTVLSACNGVFVGGLGVLPLDAGVVNSVSIGKSNFSECNVYKGGSSSPGFTGITTGTAGAIQVGLTLAGCTHDSKCAATGEVRSLTIRESSVQGCSGEIGGILVHGHYETGVLLQGVLIQDCYSPLVFAGKGGAGGLLLRDVTVAPDKEVRMEHLIVRRCSTFSFHGGGISVAEVLARLIFKGLILEECSAVMGAGIFINGWPPDIFALKSRLISFEHSVIARNRGTYGGGLAMINSLLSSVGPNVTISDNIGFGAGGGILLYDSYMTVGASVLETFRALDVDKNMLLSQTEMQDWKASKAKDFYLLETMSAAVTHDMTLQNFMNTLQLSESHHLLGDNMEDDMRVLIKGNRALGGDPESLSRLTAAFGLPAWSGASDFAGHGGGIGVANAAIGCGVTILSGTTIVDNMAGVGGGICVNYAIHVVNNNMVSGVASVKAAGNVIIDNNMAVPGDRLNLNVLMGRYIGFELPGGNELANWGDGGGIWVYGRSSSSIVTLLSGTIVRGNHAVNGILPTPSFSPKLPAFVHLSLTEPSETLGSLSLSRWGSLFERRREKSRLRYGGLVFDIFWKYGNGEWRGH